MKEPLRAGIRNKFQYLVPGSKIVSALYSESEEFQKMPEVFATGYLVGLVEWACIETVNPYLDWPSEQTVGTHINISHLAQTPPGLEVQVDVQLAAINGRRLKFEIEARNDLEVISRGTHERYIVDAAWF